MKELRSIINNKKGLTPRNWIIIGVMISMLFIISSTWITEWDGKYYENDTASNFSSYNYIPQLAIQSEEMQSSLKSENEVATIGFLDFIVKGSYNALLAVIGIPVLFVSLIYDVANTYAIPSSIVTGLITIMTVSLVFGIIGTIFRRKT